MYRAAHLGTQQRLLQVAAYLVREALCVVIVQARTVLHVPFHVRNIKVSGPGGELEVVLHQLLLNSR